MDIEVAANFADVISGVAVFVSLVYVSIQIRRNTRVSQGIAIQQAFTSTQEIYTWHANNSDVSALYAKFNQGKQLSLTEMVRIAHLMLGMIELYQVYFILNKLDMMDDKTFNSFFRKIILVLGTPTARKWFTTNKGFFQSDFVAHVDKLLDENLHVLEVLSRFYGLDEAASAT